MSPQIDANRYTNEMLFELLEVLPVPMYAYAPDGDRYVPIYMNQRCLDMLGAASLDDAIAFYEGSMRHFFLSSDLGLVRDSSLRALESEGDRVTYECHIATMDHRIRLARVLSEGRTTADGHRVVVNLVVALGARPTTKPPLASTSSRTHPSSSTTSTGATSASSRRTPPPARCSATTG